MRLPNIAQVEFIRAREREDVARLQVECVGRMLDGADIKTTLRFYDDGTLTELVETFEQASRRLAYIHRHFMRASWIVRKYWNWQSKRLASRELMLRERATAVVAAQLTVALHTKQPVAIEYDYRKPLRWVRADEAHELAEMAAASSAVQIFISDHADLLSDDCKVIAQLY